MRKVKETAAMFSDWFRDHPVYELSYESLFGESGFSKEVEGTFTSISVALMVSSLIFTFAHRSPFSFPAAFLGGLVLGLIFIRKGVETAIAAHVAADFLFFTASYILME